ncbi:jg10181 [Pararge aegeria aegeria]|uniref:Jg10181 protein n=1 Tax=Pararge aegeria aegeria TaxID=348720 RepID=A0A8S4S4R0_9NEOP|nr:jg10181 [Pararge aegeria aegeria]
MVCMSQVRTCVAQVYWASGLHLYTPLPFQPGKGGLGELFRSHLFVNAGCLAHPEEAGAAVLEALGEARVACGAGVALRLGRAARVELNYCVPLRARPSDVAAPGLQLGVAAHLL